LAGHVQTVIVYFYHSRSVRLDNQQDPRFHSEPHVCDVQELRMVDVVRSLCRELRVTLTLESCCPQLGEIDRSVSHPLYRVSLITGRTLCDGAVLRDNTFCPCCTSDCAWPPQDRGLALPSEESGLRFRGDESLTLGTNGWELGQSSHRNWFPKDSRIFEKILKWEINTSKLQPTLLQFWHFTKCFMIITNHAHILFTIGETQLTQRYEISIFIQFFSDKAEMVKLLMNSWETY
jgi:hypothetical protein